MDLRDEKTVSTIVFNFPWTLDEVNHLGLERLIFLPKLVKKFEIPPIFEENERIMKAIKPAQDWGCKIIHLKTRLQYQNQLNKTSL